MCPNFLDHNVTKTGVIHF